MAQPAGRVGDLRGTDYFGNKFYEIAANPSAGKRKPSRWFVPPGKDDFDQEMSVEWESWLRFRRSDPPTEQELLQNLRIMQLKKKNAIEVEKKAGKPTPMLKGMETFPQRPEYEIVPGKERKP
ncbi:hypothetical protein FQA39_LY06165 [Lamprigera yunnana]|nr:hypothetical protein FQA39_LY06165 [Lamprigera yunnana]